MLNTFSLGLRTVAFYIGYTALTTWFGITALTIMRFFSYPHRRPYILLWNRGVIRWLHWSCGVKHQLTGRENLPDQAYVILSNHQSQWETYFLLNLCDPLSTILKKELLDIPGFGWGLRLMKPIAIDRGNPREALRQMMSLGKQRLDEGNAVLVFPEGTRTEHGAKTNYARGGANLAIKAQTPVVFIAHNAGRFWPARRFLKFPGVIQIEISKPVSVEGKTSREITAMAQEWIENKVSEMNRNL